MVAHFMGRRRYIFDGIYCYLLLDIGAVIIIFIDILSNFMGCC